MTIIATCSPLSSICGTCLSKVSSFPSIFFTTTLGAVSSFLFTPLGAPNGSRTRYHLKVNTGKIYRGSSENGWSCQTHLVALDSYHRNISFDLVYIRNESFFLLQRSDRGNESRNLYRESERDREKTAEVDVTEKPRTKRMSMGHEVRLERLFMCWHVSAKLEGKQKGVGRDTVRREQASARSRWDTCTRQTSILEVALQGRSACHPRRFVSTTSRPLRISQSTSVGQLTLNSRCTAITTFSEG